MRPHKHAAPDPRDVGEERLQQVLGTSVVRFAAPWGTIPVVATAETDRISIAYWDPRAARWRFAERAHEPLRCEGLAPESPSEWNWSAEVPLAASGDHVFAVHKREWRGDDDGTTVALVVDRLAPSADPDERTLRLVDSTRCFTVSGQRGLGRHLWAGWSEARRELLLLYQARGAFGVAGALAPRPWSLVLQRVAVNGGVAPRAPEVLAEGGWELDARLDGDTLIVVHRAEPAAVRFPLLATAGGGLAIGSGPAFDALYAPLRLLTLDLAGGASSAEEIPGGEHPRIQSLRPLVITAQRQHAARALLAGPLIPLPPARPRFSWQEGGTDLIAWVRDTAGDARGVLLTEATDHPPTPLHPFAPHLRLFAPRDGLVGHRAPFDVWPTPFLQLERTEKGLRVDVLHHRTHVGLVRTRLDLGVSGGEIVVQDRTFEVWDISHGPIGDPEALTPDASAECHQFRPTAALPLTASAVALMQARRPDNTIGSFLAADTGGAPGGFFAYTDAGDGGLRVVFAPDVPPLGAPPPIDTEKVLRPDQVTGPHVPCDVWVELRAADWSDADLPGYEVGALRGQDRSLGGAMERALDTLLQSLELALGADAPNPADGITDAQFDAVDAFRSNLMPPRVVPLTASDGGAVTVTLDPGVVVRTLPVTATLDVAGALPPALWTHVPTPSPFGPLPAGALAPGSTSDLSFVAVAANPAALSLASPGAHRLSVFVAGPPGGAPVSAFTEVTAGPLVRDMVWSLHRGIARADAYRIGDLDFSVLQYDLGFRATRAGDHERLVIRFPATRRTEWRFVPGSGGQGTIDYRARVAVATTDMGLRGVLDALLEVTSFALDFTYGRAFTPGLLMRDARARDALRGDDRTDDPEELVRRRDPGAHAAIGAKPAGSSGTPTHATRIAIATRLPIAAIAIVVAVLGILGLGALVATVLALGVTIAAATVAAGVGAAIAAAVALALLVALVAIVVPPAAEAYAREQVSASFEDGTIRRQLDDQALLRYAGEGLAEALARQALERARADGHDVPAPAGVDTDGGGRDRFRGQLFQMVFVADGVCRILLRLERCEPSDGPGIDVPAPDQPGGGIDVVPGGGVVGRTSQRGRDR